MFVLIGFLKTKEPKDFILFLAERPQLSRKISWKVRLFSEEKVEPKLRPKDVPHNNVKTGLSFKVKVTTNEREDFENRLLCC